MLYKTNLVSGSRLHPESFKAGFYFIFFILFSLSIFHFSIGKSMDGVWDLVLAIAFLFFIVFIFSKKRKIIPFIQIDDNSITVKKSLFSKIKVLIPEKLDSIIFSKDTIVFKSNDIDIVIPELNAEFLQEVKVQLSKTAFNKKIDQKGN